MIFLNSAITTVISIAVGGVIGVLGSWFFLFRAYFRAVRSLTHDSFFRYCRYVLKEEELTTETLENLEHLHESYKALGLNGTGEKLYEQCKALPIRLEK